MITARHVLPLLLAILAHANARAQDWIQDVIVETYYISDANDATDTDGGGLAVGSITYRVYIDLDTGCSLRAIYGDVNHALTIASTAPFFNNADRGETFGHEVNNGALDENTVALDSWLALGGASTQRFGVLKDLDPDSVLNSPLFPNDGGSAGIADGLLQNNDPDAGIPLTASDGMLPVGAGSAVPPSFNSFGSGLDSVFLDITQAAAFTSNDVRVGCSPGVTGPTVENHVLIAQFTTTGELSFCLNVEVELTDGSVLKFVSSDSVLLADETLNGLLCYPPVCGCTDPNFLEYDPAAGCDDGSCATAIVFGCLDTTACNFDPLANFNVSVLCCYGIDDCNGLDWTLVCPDLGTAGAGSTSTIVLYPNPADEMVRIAGMDKADGTRPEVVDALGRTMPVHTRVIAGETRLDVSGLVTGWYAVRLLLPEGMVVLPFLKR